MARVLGELPPPPNEDAAMSDGSTQAVALTGCRGTHRSAACPDVQPTHLQQKTCQGDAIHGQA